MTKPTPPRLHRAVTAAAVVATTAALTAGVASQAPEAMLAHKRTVEAEVALAALPALPQVPDLFGIYGVGPVFWAAQLLGLTPDNVIKAAAGLVGGTEMATAVTQLLDLLDTISPVEAGIKGPLPSDVYDAVNGLDYTATGLADMLGPGVLTDIIDAIVSAAPVLNQRRAIIFSESLGGLTTSLAYRDMINAVQSDDPDWGVGVTGQWLIFFNNPSRPGGGLFALATPFTNLFGLNLSTPPAGSYTNEDANDGDITKVLNTSILDISWAYNPLSDAPTTLNPLAWANSAAAGVFLTYLIPGEGNNIGSHVVPLALEGLFDGVKVMLDLSGGQGLDMIPLWRSAVESASNLPLVGPALAEFLDNLTDATKFPGSSTYITYDSDNLPLLEPFNMVPRLVNLIPGYNIPTPLTNSVQDALRMLVNMGYQDVDPDDLTRDFDMAGEQAYLYDSPLTPTQQLAANQEVFNALIDGIKTNALTPSAWTPTIPGADLSPIFENALTEPVAAALRDALEAFQSLANPAFDAVHAGLAPITDTLDSLDAQVTSSLDGVFKVNEPEPDASTATNPVSPGPLAKISTVPSPQNQLRTVSVADVPTEPAAEKETKPEPLKEALKGLGLDRGSPKGLKKFKESFKATPGARHAADVNNPLKKTVKEISDNLQDSVDKVEKVGKKVEKSVNDVKTSVAKKKAAAEAKHKDKAAA